MAISNKYWYVGIVLLSAAIFLYFDSTAGAVGLRDIKLAEWFALLAAVSIYFALLVNPLYRAFPSLSGRQIVNKKYLLWHTALWFAFLHIYFAFFKLLGGFEGLAFLNGKYIFAIVLALAGLVAVCIIVFLSLRGGFGTKQSHGNSMGLPPPTQRLGRNDNWFRRKIFIWIKYLGYTAGLFIIIHAFLLGSHFKDLTKPVPLLVFALVYILCFLLAQELEGKIIQKFKWWPKFLAIWILTVASSVFITYWFVPSNKPAGMSGHNMAMMGASSSMKHYSVSLAPIGEIVPGKATELELKVFRAETGEPVKDFQVVHEKLVHLVIVDEKLEYYEHIHPEFKGDRFTVMADFSRAGGYRAYASFQPKGDEEKVFAYRFVVGEGGESEINKQVDINEEKQIENISIGVSTESLSTAGIAKGKSYLTFKLNDAITGQGLTNLYPYLGAFGHLVMISANDYYYIHVHPVLAPSIPDDTTGPEVKFMVMGSIPPGIYKLFGQFAPNKKVITVPFTAEVK